MPAHMPPDQVKELATEFYDQLDKPETTKSKPQFCICPIGLVGTGKTTVLKKICAQLRAIRVSADEVRSMLYTKGLPFDDAMYVTHEVCVRLKQEGYNIAHDGDFAAPVSRELLGQVDQELGITELWIRVQAPEDVTLKNIKARGPGILFRDIDHAVSLHQRRKELHAAPEIDELPFMYTFDTSRPGIDDQVAEFVRLAQARLG